MTSAPSSLPRRTVGEWVLRCPTRFRTPFTDVTVEARFTAPSGKTIGIPGFHDGGDAWRVRFNPGEVGTWRYEITSRPSQPGLDARGSFEVTPREAKGFLRATPGQAWGFHWESGEPAFLFGDTVYNLIGMAHCGGDVESFLRRRKSQGFNILRIRVPVSRFHHPEGYSEWQTRSCLPWGGSESWPRFDQFNIEYFKTVDHVIALCEVLEIGIELIMEGWGFEFPFNARTIFTAEWEELYLRYLIARYDAYSCVYFWTPLNEYEYYPNGDWNHKVAADRWALRISRWIKSVAGHGHIVSMHNGPRLPPFAERFRGDPQAVDAVMYQEWGTRDAEQGWLAAGIEETIGKALAGWQGSAVFAEWGYERNPALELKLPSHEFCDVDHSRRAAWRGAFCALGLIHGFENSWGPWMILDRDQPGVAEYLLLKRFLTEIVPFAELRPAPELLVRGQWQPGRAPMVLASPSRHIAAVYLPAGGSVVLSLDTADRQARWFDPRTGALTPASAASTDFTAPATGASDRPHDYVLVLQGK